MEEPESLTVKKLITVDNFRGLLLTFSTRGVLVIDWSSEYLSDLFLFQILKIEWFMLIKSTKRKRENIPF